MHGVCDKDCATICNYKLQCLLKAIHKIIAMKRILHGIISIKGNSTKNYFH